MVISGLNKMAHRVRPIHSSLLVLQYTGSQRQFGKRMRYLVDKYLVVKNSKINFFLALIRTPFWSFVEDTLGSKHVYDANAKEKESPRFGKERSCIFHIVKIHQPVGLGVNVRCARPASATMWKSFDVKTMERENHL